MYYYKVVGTNQVLINVRTSLQTQARLTVSVLKRFSALSDLILYELSVKFLDLDFYQRNKRQFTFTLHKIAILKISMVYFGRTRIRN